MPSNIYVSASGAMARLTQLDLVANNLANADTAGYKRDAAFFESVLEASLTDKDGKNVEGASGLNFVRSQGISSDFEAGPIKKTGAPLDIAILGRGFLEIQTDQGLRYTRAGSLVVNEAGKLTTRDGQPVMGNGGPIEVSGSGIHIAPNGEVLAGNGNRLGRVKIVEFENLQALRKEGHLRFEAREGAGPNTLTEPSFATESLEGSNVNTVRELSALMLLQRAFDANVRTLQADDDATARLIREVRG